MNKLVTKSLIIKIYLVVLFNFLFGLQSFAQTSKVYVTSDGGFSDNPKKAVSYVLIEKLSDSAYGVHQFDMRDTIMSEGTYKDRALTIENGRFYYYAKEHVDKRIKDVIHIDTNTYVKSTGFFENGLKSGAWVEYETRNVLNCSYIYINGKINGLFQYFDHKFNTYVTEEGHYVDDKREGEWNTYGYDTLKTPVVTAFYKNDIVVKTVNHIKMANFSENLENYLSKKLRPQLDVFKNNPIETEIVINEEGNVKEVRIIHSISTKIDLLIKSTILNAPKFTPEKLDGKPLEKKYFLKVEYSNLRDGDFTIYLNHDVGNGMKLEKMFLPVKF